MSPKRSGMRSGSVLGGIVGDAQARRHASERATKYASFTEFVLGEIHTDYGPYSFRNHEAFRHIASTIDRVTSERIPDAELAVQKGTQIGITTLFLAWSLYAVAQLQLKGTIYYLPTNKIGGPFLQTRYTPIVRQSPLLSERMATSSKADGLMEFREPDGASRNLYVLGLDSTNNAISIPADFLLYDEVDRINAENIAWSRDRLDGSALRWQAFFAAGMIPRAGINARYESGCQYTWLVRCPSCRREQVAEELWPDCCKFVDGEWRLVCVGCGKPYDVEAAGQWVARFPDRERDHRYSWRLPQMVVPRIELAGVMRKWQSAQGKPSKLAKFDCSSRAMPNGGAATPISVEMLDQAEQRATHTLRRERGSRLRVAGLDIGTLCHLAVLELDDDGNRLWTWFEQLDSDSYDRHINEHWDEYGFAGLVIDASPFQSQNRQIAYAHPGQVWLQSYATGRGELAADMATTKVAEHLGREFQRVVVPRTLALDELCDLYAEGSFRLPNHGVTRPRILQEVRTQTMQLRRDPETGDYKEDPRANDHFAFAQQMALTAARLIGLQPAGSRPSTPYQTVQRRPMAGLKERAKW